MAFEFHYENCITCGKWLLIVVKAGNCGSCNEKSKEPAREAARKRRTCLGKPNPIPMSQKKKKVTGELEVFKKIWKDRPHVSEVSGDPIHRFNINCFSHLLGKQAFPSFKLLPKNIMLKTVQEHKDWHRIAKSKLIKDPMWVPVFEKYDELKAEYHRKTIGKNRL